MKNADAYRETDVLVIGTGLAGCATALAAAQRGLKVLMITASGDYSESSSYYAQGGIIYRAVDDEFNSFLEDFVNAGHNIVNPKAVREIYDNVKDFVDEIFLDELAVPFSRKEDGELHLTMEAAHSKARIAHVEDHTGKTVQKYFIDKIKTVKNIEFINKATAVNLITLAHNSVDYHHVYETSTCSGAYVLFQDSGEVHPVLSKYTVLATGGLGRLYIHTSNPPLARGDGYAMAYRAGARIMNMEYTQFHPTTLYSRDEERFLLTEAIRGEGGVLRNKFGEDFMPKYHELGSLAPRDIVSRSIMQEMLKTNSNHVTLDISHKDSSWIKERFPMIYQKCMSKKIDMAVEGIPVVPAAHYECGGVYTDNKANTTINRLKAVGEVACTGLHGANRLASSSLAECLVYGTLAGIDCAERINKDKFIMPEVYPWQCETEPVDMDLIRQDYQLIRQTMWNYVGIVRTKKKLQRAYSIINNLETDIEQFYSHSRLSDGLIGLRNAALTSLLVIHASNLNKKSRGCHYRID